MMNPIADLAGIFTALSAFMAGLFGYFTVRENRQQKSYDESIARLDQEIDELKAEHKLQLKELREDYTYQLDMLRRSVAAQAETITRQERLIADQHRHIGKLERVMAAAGLTIPEFVPTPYEDMRGNVGEG